MEVDTQQREDELHATAVFVEQLNSQIDRSVTDTEDSEVRGGPEYYNKAASEDDTPSFLPEIKNARENSDKPDTRRELIQFVCRKLLPSQKTLDIFGNAEEWRKRVSIVLTHAVKISSEPMVLQALRFCSDLISVIIGKSLPDTKWNYVLVLGNMLQTDENSRLDSPECFDCLCGLVFTEPNLPLKDSKRVFGSYLNRCIAADPETEAVIKFLQLPLDAKFLDSDFDILKPPLQFSIESSVLKAEEKEDDLFFSLVKSTDDELILRDYPLLHTLDTTLKSIEGSVRVDSQFVVLIVDILEEHFSQTLNELIEGDVDEAKTVLFGVLGTFCSCKYGLKFISAIAFYKSFMNQYAEMFKQEDFPTSNFKVYLPVVKALVDREGDSPTLQATKQYFVKAIGRGLFPWSLYTKCEKLTGLFDFLKTWKWTDNYMFQCLEGNPLFQCAPAQVTLLLNILDKKDIARQQIMFRSYLTDNKDCTGLLALHAVSMSRFYVQRRYKQQDDTYTQLAEAFVHIAEEERLESKNIHFLACTLGVRLFSWLELHECSDELQSACAIFSSSLYAVLLSSNHQSTDTNRASLLSRLLLCPSRVEAVVLKSLRSLSKRRQCERSGENNELCVTCSCRYRMFMRNVEHRDNMNCPVCLQEISKPASVSKLSTNKGTEVLKSFITSIVEDFIELCMNACFLGSLILETSTEKELETVTGICEIDDIPNTLVAAVHNTFKDLQNSLALSSRDIYIFLQTCLLNVRGYLTDNIDYIFTEEKLHEWVEIITLNLAPLIRDRYKTIIDSANLNSRGMPKTSEEPELCVNENDTLSIKSDERQRMLPSLFRMQGTGNRAMFEFELDIMAERAVHPYPFLQLVMDVLPSLALTEHILAIIRWHMATAAQIECRMKKRHCLEMTVEDFIHNDWNESVRKRLQERFESLQGSLSVLKEADQRFEVLDIRLTCQTKMKDCLILDSKSVLYTVIKNLCGIQNAFLDSVLEISVTRECSALEFLSKCRGISAVPVIGVAELKGSSIVKYQWDDELLKFSQADLRYGYGSQIRYEFEAIEKLLALKLVAGKCYIALENSLPSITFVDEFYKGYSKMAKEISNIIPQKNISTEIIQKVKEKREKHPRLTVELLTHTGVLISLVKKTKGEVDMPLIEYVETWKHVLTSPMPSRLLPAPENCIRLCHLIDLYGLLEELNADSLVDSLSDEYRKSISLDIQNQLNGLFRTNQRLAEMTLRATKRFVHRCLSFGNVDATQPLSDYLSDDSFWPCDIASVMENLTGASGDGGRKSPTEHLPKDLKVHSVSSMIAHLESKLKELSDKDVKLREIATSFVSRGTRTTAQKIRKLAQKRIV